MQISDTIPREPNSVDWMESRGSVFLMSTSGSLTLADEAGLSWGQLHTSENHQLWVQAPQLHSPILTPRLLLWECNSHTHTPNRNRSSMKRLNESSMIRRLLFTSAVELVRTEIILREVYSGGNPNFLHIELKKKIYEVKRVNPTTFGKQFNKKYAVKHIIFCPLASYQGKGKEILQTVNKTINSAGHFFTALVAFPFRLRCFLSRAKIYVSHCKNLSSSLHSSGIDWVMIVYVRSHIIISLLFKN